MSKRASYRQIGIFVIGAAALLIGALMVFGSGKFFQDNVPAVLYFDESVKGLVIGAPVSYRGVKIGEVREIGLVLKPDTDKLYIPVQISLIPRKATRLGHENEPPPSRAAREDFFRRMIQKGLRGQLAVDSLVTGQLYVNFDFMPQEPLRLTQLNDHELEIPTVASGLEQLLGEVKKIPIDQIAGQTQSILTRLDKVLADKEVEKVAANLNVLLDDTRSSIKSLSEKMDRVLANADQRLADPELAKAVKNFNVLMEDGRVSLAELTTKVSKSLDNAEQVLVSVNGTMSKDSPLYYRLTAALEEISNAARALRVFADYIEQHPEAVLRGKN